MDLFLGAVEAFVLAGILSAAGVFANGFHIFH